MIYISGPMSGIDNYRENFNNAEDQIFKEGIYVPINPAKVLDALPHDYMQYKELMRVCLYLLSMCDSIYMLTGWENSEGATLEHDFARTRNYEILYQK